MHHLFFFRRATFVVATLAILGLGRAAAAARPVPFRGRADLMITGLENLSPTSQRLTASATGRATHLGRFTRTETLLVNLTNGTFTGTQVFIAANGDRLNSNVSGHFTSASSAEGTYVFTGGTGRFQNASGRATFEVTPDGTNFNVTFKGTIQYQASGQ